MAMNRENVIRAAEKYVSRGKLEAAIKEYRKVLAENPSDANTLNRVGDLYARIERFDEAVKLFSQIAEQYTRDGFFVKAIAIYKKIIKLDPTLLQVYEKLAELYHKQGLLNEARTQYQVLADYYQKHDNAASAITIYQRMSELEPDNPSFHLKLAELYESQRLADKAIKEYRLLADLLIVSGSVDEAVQVYTKALEVNTEDLAFVRETVSGLRDGGHMGAAAKLLAKAVDLNPAAAAVAEQLGIGSPAAPEPLLELEAEPMEAAPIEGLEAPGFDPGATMPLMDEAPGEEPSFADADTFEIPETSFGDLEEVLEEASFEAPVELGAPQEAASFADFGDPVEAAAEPAEDEVFTFDLDDDEVPESLVAPPPDMLEPEPGSPIDLEEDATLVSPPEEAAGPEEAVLPHEEEEVEIEWSLDEMELDLTLPDADSEPDEVPFVELEDEPAAGPEPEPEEVPFVELEDEPAAGPEPEPEPEEVPLGELADEPAADEDFDLSFDIVEPGSTAAESAGGREALPELEPVLFEEAAAAPEPAAAATGPTAEEAPAVRREEDLLAEAKVFAKYGLLEKARDRLSELFDIRPQHLEGLALQIRMDLEAGQHDAVQSGANLLAQAAADAGDAEPWHEIRGELAKAGFTVDEDQVVGEPGAKEPEDDRIAQLLEDLSLESFETPTAAPAVEAVAATPVAEVPVVESPIAESPAAESPAAEAPNEEASIEEASIEEPAVEEAAETLVPETPAADEKKLISLVDELGLDDLQDEEEVPAVAAAAAAEESPAAPAIDPLDETGMSWLDEVQPEKAAAKTQEETIFDDEDDFFDLAAELERELSEDDVTDAMTDNSQDQSLQDIIEGFKQGVAENLSPEDYDTHFNLGIAYREMGLLDEAIGEFQLASKDDRYIVDCSSLLGLCFLEKGLPELAVRWYRKGLESPSIEEEATLGLLYDMGNAYLTLGDSAAAHKTFIEIYGLNSNYRDVSTKLESLSADG